MRRIAALVGAVLVVALGVVGFVLVRGGSARQPVAFSHRQHVEDASMLCTDCHLYAETGMRATIPNVDICAYCHSEPLTESPDEARVVEHIASGEPIPWQKVHVTPDHVFFSHRRHTAIAELECQTCHGSVEEMDEALTRPLVRITMDRCISCHEEDEASNDCILCHR
jgi:hypothetical protein